MTEGYTPKRDEWKQGWPIVLSSLVGIALCLSPLPYYTLIVLMPELITQFGWSRAQVSSGFLCMTVGVLIGAPFVGVLTDRYGSRRVVLPSIVLLGLMMAVFSTMNGNIWVFYTIFTLLALLSVGTLPITWSKAIVNNFDHSRGIALGIALTGTGIFGFLAPPYTQWLIDNFGWRNAYLGIAILPLLLSFPLAFFLFRDPKEDAAMSKQKKLDTSHLPGLTMSEVLKDYRFYIILLSFLILGAAVSGILANSKLILMDKGYSPQDASSLFKGAGLIGMSVIIGRFVGGFLMDIIWAPLVAFIFMIVPAYACYLFMQPDSTVMMHTIALILTGLAAGVEYDLMAYLVSRYLGMKSYGKIYAFIYAAFGLGSGVSPLVFNILQQNTGSYESILKVAAFGFIIGATLLLFLGRYRDFDAPTSSPETEVATEAETETGSSSPSPA